MLGVDVSIILNLHRESNFLRRTLRSLLQAINHAQFHGGSFELIIVLDNADDKTRKIVNDFDFAFVDRVVVKNVSNASLGQSRNDGIAAATGSFIATADADDLVSVNYFAAMLDTAKAAPKNRVFVPQYYVGFGDNYHLCEFFGTDRVSKFLLFDTHPFVSRIFAPAEVFKAISFAKIRREDPFAYEDWHFNCELLALGYEIMPAAGTSVYYRQRPGSMLRNADAESLKCIPPSKYFEPEVFLDITKGQGDPETAPSWQVLRRRFESDSVNLEMMLLANKIDPAINYGLPDSYSVFSYVGRDDRLGRVYRAVCEIVGSQKYTDVFLVPFLVVGGGDKYVIEVMNGLVDIDPERKLLVLGLQPCAEQVWADRIPQSAQFIDLAKMCNGLPAWSHEQIVLRLLQTSAKGANVYLKSAESTLHFYEKYKSVLADNPTTYFRFMDILRQTDSYRWALGFDFDFLSNCGESLAYVVSDNMEVLKQDRRSLDTISDKMHLLYAYCDMPGQPRAATTQTRKLLWASRLDGQKRPDLLLGIAARLLKEMPEIEIHVYGGSVLESFDVSRFSKLANISYHGPYSKFNELPLEDFSAFLYTSDFDGLPNVVLEAMACGLPVIAPKIGGIPEAVTADNGYLVDGSPNINQYVNNYYEAIVQLLGDEPRRLARSEAARAHISKHHSWAAYTGCLSQIYAIERKQPLIDRQ